MTQSLTFPHIRLHTDPYANFTSCPLSEATSLLNESSFVRNTMDSKAKFASPHKMQSSTVNGESRVQLAFLVSDERGQNTCEANVDASVDDDGEIVIDSLWIKTDRGVQDITTEAKRNSGAGGVFEAEFFEIKDKHKSKKKKKY